MGFRGSVGVLTLGLISLLGGTGCLKSTLLKGQIQSTRLAATAADTLHDYEVARQAAFAGLVQFEGMHKLAPTNEDALFLLMKGWVGASYGFIEDDLEIAEDLRDRDVADYHKQRALAGYERAIQYGIELLGLHAEGFNEARKNADTLRAWLNQNFVDKQDAENLLWFGYAWVARTNVAKDDPAMVAELWIGVTLVEHAVKLDETQAYGNGLTILGAYHARTAQSELDESKRLFDKVFALTQSHALLARFNYATRYLCAKADLNGYKKTLQEIVDAGDVLPEQRLQNAIAKRRARRYLGQARLAEMREECSFPD